MKISIHVAFLLVCLALTASSVEHEEEEKGNPEFLVDAPNTTNEEKINDELTKSSYRGRMRRRIHPECGYCGYSLRRRACACACKNGPRSGPGVRLCGVD